MIGYASRTGTRVNLDGLRAAGWRLMVSATGVLRTEGFPYAIDNGAWTSFNSGVPYSFAKFIRAVDKLGDGADWIVCPDVVGDAVATLRLADEWLPRLAPARRLLAVQDGMTVDDVRPILGADVGIFIGGSDAWKERTAGMWGILARDVGCHLHVGRVNSMRRINICGAAGAHSFDGLSASKYSKTLPLLNASRLMAPRLLQWSSPWL